MIKTIKKEDLISIKQLKNAVNIPVNEMDDWGNPKTIGEPIAHLNGIQMIENEDGSEGGIWECSPGKFVREIIETVRKAYLYFNLKK